MSRPNNFFQNSNDTQQAPDEVMESNELNPQESDCEMALTEQEQPDHNMGVEADSIIRRHGLGRS